MYKFIRLFPFLILFILSSCTHTHKEYYTNGEIKSVISYKGKKENGLTTYYRADGTKKLEINMKNGKKEGKLTRWFSGQKVESESYYKNNLLDGIERIYDREGYTITEIHYKEGKKNGYFATWHSRDVLKEEGTFFDDLYDGKWHYFDKRGFPVGEGLFNKGNGVLKGYDQEGNLIQITHYTHNQKNGEEIQFYANGDTLKKTFYNNDRIISVTDY